MNPYIFIGLPPETQSSISRSTSFQEDEKQLSILFSACCETYEVDMDDQMNHLSCRKKECNHVRQLYFFMARKNKIASLERIARFVGLNHATCHNGVNRFKERLEGTSNKSQKQKEKEMKEAKQLLEIAEVKFQMFIDDIL